MKNLFNFTFPIFLLFIGGCTLSGGDGPPGPRGPQGPAGVDGQEAFVFEYVDLTFSAANNYNLFLEFPSDFQMLESDKVLVYFLYSNPQTDDPDLWRLLPQTEFLDGLGTLVYNYDFTRFDVRLFLNANFDLNLLGANSTDNWIARVVVVPGQFNNARTADPVDFENYDAVMEHYNLTDKNIVDVK